jgi:dGTPase
MPVTAPWSAEYTPAGRRKYPETQDPYRNCFQRDRDRILYSTAFKRLQYKTQVYVVHEADFYRTRLTHTLEVAQHARTVARALGANEDLTEAIAMAHDLGHAPFGHAGEKTLDELMRGFGGFEHNIQSLRIVDFLEKRYPTFDGLNLTFETREGIARHTTSYDHPHDHHEFMETFQPGIEAQIVNLSDQIAFVTHDLEDALMANLLSEERLADCNLILWDEICTRLKRDGVLEGDERLRRRQLVRHLIELFNVDLIKESTHNCQRLAPQSPDDIRRASRPVICLSEEYQREFAILRNLLYEEVYHHPSVLVMVHKGSRLLREMFQLFLEEPRLLPLPTQERWDLAADDLERRRVLCDYLSGMTDKYAMETYKRLLDPYEKVLTAFGR